MKNNCYFTRCLFASFFLLAGPQAFPAEYFVAPAGNDNNPGTAALPLRTIGQAANKAVAGDVVTVTAGTYPEMVQFPRSGAPGQYITFRASGPVIVRDPCPESGSCGVWLWGGIFEIENRSYLRISGFRLENSYFFGIAIKSSSNIIVENNHTFHTGGSGIYAASSSFITIAGNKVQQACWQTSSLSTQSQECITLSDVNTFEVKNNEVFESGTTYALSTGGEGIDAKGSSANGSIHHNTVHDLVRLGIYLDAWSSVNENHQVYANVVYNCREGILLNSENGGTLQHVNVYNNLIYNNQQSGIALEDYGQGISYPRNNIYLVNNTIYNNGYSLYSGGITVRATNIANLVIRNNICSKNRYWQIRVDNPAMAVVSHNLIHDFVGDAKETRGADFVAGDPLFTDPVAGDFTLSATSPALDKGTLSDAPPVDFAGHARPAGPGVDMGAYEMNYANALPAVSLTAPANGATYAAPASLTIGATATDSDGSISKVAFYQGGTLLGEDFTSPYSYTWNNAAAGQYTLTARATDNAGGSTASVAVTVTVTAAAPAPVNLALNRPVSVSSSGSKSTGGAKAVDGSYASQWTSKGGGAQWVLVDLGAVKPLSRIKLSWASLAYARDFSIALSADKLTWTPVAAGQGYGAPGYEVSSLSASARYVRVNVTAGNNTYYALQELEAYGPSPARREAATRPSGTGTPLPRDENVLLRPNPTTGRVTLSLGSITAQTSVEVRVRDAYSKVLFASDFPGQSHIALDLTAFPAGLYYVSVNHGRKFTVKKVLVCH